MSEPRKARIVSVTPRGKARRPGVGNAAVLSGTTTVLVHLRRPIGRRDEGLAVAVDDHLTGGWWRGTEQPSNQAHPRPPFD